MNYYHLDSTLSGHTDHSEKDLSIPLLSVRLDDILPMIQYCGLKKFICMKHQAALNWRRQKNYILLFLLQFRSVCYFPGRWQDQAG